jgi:hypothetical protein
MKKIMFMMMPLFLTALIFGAGCDQDPSTTKDTGNDSSTVGDDVVADVTIQATAVNAVLKIDQKGVLTSTNAGAIKEADWTKSTINKVRFIGTASATLTAVTPVGDETWPVFVPAGKTLVLSGDGDIVVDGNSKIMVDGKLFVENGMLTIGNNYNPQFEQIVLRNGSLRVYQGATLAYGQYAKVTSILKGDRSALKYGGIEFKKDEVNLNLASGLPAFEDIQNIFELASALDLSKVPSNSTTFVIRETDPLEDENQITLAQIYANSGDAIVTLNQTEYLDSDYILDFPPLRADRLLIVNGGYGGVDEEWDGHPETITIRAGLAYTGIKSDLEHKDVIVNGALMPTSVFGGEEAYVRKVYARNLTIAPGAIYYNYGKTDIDSELVVNGEGLFNELEFTEINENTATVGTDGKLVIASYHTFNYSPEINGTLELEGGGELEPNEQISASGKFIAGDFLLGNGILNARTGSVYIDDDGRVRLDGNSILTVSDLLEVYDDAQVSVGWLVSDEYSGTNDPVYYDALTLQRIKLEGAFTLTGGTESAQLTATGSVKFGSASTPTGALSGHIVFGHGTAGANQNTRFAFTYDKLQTNGSESSLILGSDGQIVFGAAQDESNGVSLTHGTYSVRSNEGVPEFILGNVTNDNDTKDFGIGINDSYASNAYNNTIANTSLILTPDSRIRFALKGPAQAYLLTGAGAGDRNPSYTHTKYPSTNGSPVIPLELGSGTEPSRFAISGTIGANSTQGSQIIIDNVIIAGSLGHVSNVQATAVPLFTYNTENLGGTAATGNITVIYGSDHDPALRPGGGGGSLTVDHNYNWRYTDHGWVGTK